jgi:uncharacterized protein
MSSTASLWRGDKAAIEVRVRVTPKSSRDSVEGVEVTGHGPALKIKVRAAADRGEANRAVEKVVALWLGLPRTSVTIAAGAASRTKTVGIAGDPRAVEILLQDRLAVLPRRPGETRGGRP